MQQLFAKAAYTTAMDSCTEESKDTLSAFRIIYSSKKSLDSWRYILNYSTLPRVNIRISMFDRNNIPFSTQRRSSLWHDIYNQN